MLKKMTLDIQLSAAAILLLTLGTPSARGEITYTLHFDPASNSDTQVLANSVPIAADFYNTYGSFNKHWDVYYNTGIGTAEGSYSGYMGYGTQFSVRTVMHEGAHTLGMGQTAAYANLTGGLWRGPYGHQVSLDTFKTALAGDGHAIWPGGFNYENEDDGFINRIWMVRVQNALRCDSGILAYSKEARNELVHPGETAEFSVEAPVGKIYQWYKDLGGGSYELLSNGGDISGADSPTLRIANAEVADETGYFCTIRGGPANEPQPLKSRTRQLFVHPAQQVGQWDMDNDVTDASGNGNHGTAFGSPAYVNGVIGQAIDLDGADDYVSLPPAVGYAKDITVATWVNWDGGGNWQRIFDFGTGIYQYMYVTPKSDSNKMVFSFRDAINGSSTPQTVETTALPTGQWVHLAAVLNKGYATLYVNGEAAGTTPIPVTNPIDFLPTKNYIGKSQFANPYFNGRVDDFQVYNYALDGSQVWDLWGQSGNAAPVFPDTISRPPAYASIAYSGLSLTNDVFDADGDTLTFSKIGGPAWLSVGVDGSLSGTPGDADTGLNTFYIRAQDPSGASSDCILAIDVEPNHPTGPVAHWDFADAGAANDTFMPGNGERADLNANGAMDPADFRIASTDLSGNGNHLTAWSSAWMKWSSVSTLGDFSMTGANGYPAAGTDSIYNPSITGVDAEAITPAKWTVEATFRPTALGGNQTIVGRDGAYTGTYGMYAPLYLSTRGTDLAIEYVDAAFNHHNLQVAAGLANNTWYHVAATSDGATLRLWLNGSQIGSLNVSGSANSALVRGYGAWSVARGMFDAGHVDRFTGYIDEVAISTVDLNPGSFVITGTWPSGYEFYVDDFGIPGEPFAGDWNNNGIPNGMEYFLGWDPTDLLPPQNLMAWTNDYHSVLYPFNPAAYGVTGMVEWTEDLTSGIWSSSGVSYATNSILGEIEATMDATSANNEHFVRLKVSE